MADPGIDAVPETRPYALKGRFLRYILPTLGLILVASVSLTVMGSRALVQSVYLQVAQQRAELIVRTAQRRAPEDWARLSRLTGADAIPHPSEIRDLTEAIEKTLVDLKVQKLKIYDSDGRLIFNTEGQGLGGIERGPFISDLLEDNEPQIIYKEMPEGPQYEIYVWVGEPADGFRVVLELYEPVSYLNAIMIGNLAPQVAVPAALVLGLTIVLWRMVSRAQAEITLRDQALIGMRDRLSRLVSTHAVGAARRAVTDGTFGSSVLDVTLYHADVRDFTSFSEEIKPEDVVAFLNRVISLQVRLIQEYGGDVDKIIGDAILAVFEGPRRTDQAIACAQAVQARMLEDPDLARPIGIGVHDGHVISGVVGPEERQDFTVIGDAVNVAARLSSMAKGGELCADTRTLARAGHPDGFGEPEDVMVKGRAEPLRIRRWRMPSAGPTRI